MKVGRPPIPGIRLVALRLFEKDLRRAKREAKRRGMPYQAVIREWVAATR